MVINVAAAFLLGLIVGRGLANNASFESPFFMMVGVGFLGSLSTFSTFIIEVLEIFLRKNWMDGIVISFVSISSGLLAASLGYQIGHG